MSDVLIREATADDAYAVADIYNHYVLHSTVTFDVEPQAVEDRVGWLEGRSPEHPVLIAEIDGETVGWGSLSRFGDRCAWRQTVELSIYVDHRHLRKGVGSALFSSLVQAADRLGHHALMGRITADNEASIALARKHGFEEVGRLREVGRKFDRWLDVVIMERTL